MQFRHNEQRMSQPKQVEYSAEEILAFRKMITKATHPDLFSELGQRQKVEETQKMINNAYDALENNNRWSDNHLRGKTIPIAGRNREGIFRAGKTTIGSPLDFLNNIYRFLFKENEGSYSYRPDNTENTSTSRGGYESSSDISDLVARQKADFLRIIEKHMESLKQKNIILNLSNFYISESVRPIILVTQIIEELLNNFAKRSPHKIELTYYSKELGYPDTLSIKFLHPITGWETVNINEGSNFWSDLKKVENFLKQAYGIW